MSMEQSLQGAPEALETDGNVEEGKQYLTFRMADQKFGIPVSDVIQIIGIQEIISVPEYPTYAKGIIRLRDMIIPVIDLRVRFHKEAREYDDRTCIIVTTIMDEPFGLIADQVDAVLHITEDQISPPPQMTKEQSEYAYLAGVAMLEKDLVLLLDTQKVIFPAVAQKILDLLPEEADEETGAEDTASEEPSSQPATAEQK